MPPILPFAHLNLTRNPFGELSLEERSGLAVSDLESFIPHLKQVGFVLQILGDCGRGKTSQLLSLRRHFPNAPYIHYPEEGPRPDVPLAPLLLLDETQRFTPRELKTLLKRNASFVIGTHEDHTKLFKQLGLEHHTVYLRGLDSKRLTQILKLRLEASQRGPGPIPVIEDELIYQLIHRFSDDIRATEQYLYEVFQNLETVGPIKLETLD